MILNSVAETNEFRLKFVNTIEQYAVDHKIDLQSFHNDKGRKIFVDPQGSRELLFLVQLYNEISLMLNEISESVQPAIDLKKIMQDKLKEHGLSGISVNDLDKNLLMFFSRYDLVEPDQKTGKLNELKDALKQMGEQHYMYASVNELVKSVEAKSQAVVVSGGTRETGALSDSCIDNILSDTRKFVAPKFGEKNCFSYDARQAEYKRKAVTKGFASAGCGILGALSCIVGAAWGVANFAGIVILGVISGPFAIPAIMGGLLASCITLLPAGLMAGLGFELLGKADNLRKMSGTMFSIANAKDPGVVAAKKDVMVKVDEKSLFPL